MHGCRQSESLLSGRDILIPRAFQESINARGTNPILPLIHEIERILGPFYLPTHPSVAAIDSDDWEGAYTSDYVLPGELKLRAELTREPKRGLVASVDADNDVEVLEGLVVEYSKSKKEALTEALAFTHSRSKYSFLIVEHRC